MNLITKLIERIEEYRTTNKKPCKSYASQATAEKAANTVAAEAAKYFLVKQVEYLVFYNPAWNRWCVAFDLGKILQAGAGGYVGFISDRGFYTY